MTERNDFPAFLPPERLLLGPGPSPVAADVLAAMARPTIGHLDPAFVAMMNEVKAMLRIAFETSNAATYPVAGPGSLGMETAIMNLVEPGTKMLIARNGVFGMRMTEVAARAGADCVTLDFTWGTAIDPDALRDAMKANPDVEIVGFVQAETSTGVLSDAAAIAEVANEFDALTVMDAVTALGGVPVRLDAWGIDATYSGTQKCLSCPPGLSPVSFSDRAAERVRNRKTKVLSWFLDLNQVMAYWGGDGSRAYHHTAPINALYGLHEALRRFVNEGPEAAFARHRAAHLRLVDGLDQLDLELLVDEAHRLPQLNAIKVPDGVDEAAIRRTLLNDYNIEIGAGLGALAGKIWRIGLMGEGARAEPVDRVLAALKAALA